MHFKWVLLLHVRKEGLYHNQIYSGGWLKKKAFEQRLWMMSSNKLFHHQTRSGKMQEAKSNPRYSVELPSCAWARRRRIWHERKFEIRDPDVNPSKTMIQTLTSNIRCHLTKNRLDKKSKNRLELPLISNKLNQVLLCIFIVLNLAISSHCLYYEKQGNAHTKNHLKNNHLSPLEGKYSFSK